MPAADKSSASDETRRAACRAQIVYQCCPDCGRSRVGTREGFVEVSSEETRRYDGSAEVVAIDGPTPARLRRRGLAREAGRCGNPRCGHLADHCHQIVFRSRGGKTEFANEVVVCTTCHALIHAGLLRVQGDAQHELRWSPVGCDGSFTSEVASGRAQAEQLPVLRLVADPVRRETLLEGAAESAIADSTSPPTAGRGESDLNGSTQSANADSVLERVDPDELAHGLVRLGLPAARSRRLIDAAIAALPPAEITDANVLRTAIRSI